MEEKTIDLDHDSAALTPAPATFSPTTPPNRDGSPKLNGNTHALSPAVSAFQSFWPAQKKPSSSSLHVPVNASAGPHSDPLPSSAARPNKDGYVYKDKFVVLDSSTKQRLRQCDPLPLQSSWTFWYDRYIHNLPAAEYEANLQKIATVSTVQKFWSVYNNIDGPDHLGFRSNLHFMRNGIKPIWEDPKNAHGGSYNFKVNKQQSPTVWRDLIVLMVGENIEPWVQDELCGLSVSSRQQCDNYQLWIASTQDKNEPDGKIKATLIKHLQPVDIQAFYFKIHKNHAAFQGNHASPRHYHASSHNDTSSSSSLSPAAVGASHHRSRTPNSTSTSPSAAHRATPPSSYASLHASPSSMAAAALATSSLHLSSRPFVQVKQKITEENIEQVVADIERLSMKKHNKPIRRVASKPIIHSK
ncbi:translation initiation factor eIF 4e-like domain-containing protein [Gongronella butleri]|nr:translation initiation factor eIF 4e-like domain-containing protein [Gongronella butleri]